jgi:sugar/nucleoside kinase (ribokinase family)
VIVLGDVVYDLLVEPDQPVAVGDDTRARITSRPGGAGANLATWLARLGIETYLVGRIGQDALGQDLRATLDGDGVQVRLAVDESRPTGKIVVLVGPAGERTMISDRGANLGLRVEDIPVALFTPGSHLHLSGYSFFEPATRLVAQEALRLARNAGMTVSIDPASAAQLTHIGPGQFIGWTAGCDLCFPNLDEGRVLTGTHLPGDVAAALLRHYRAVVLKLGAQGAIFARSPTEPVALPAEPARAVDTTGAGDAFCAAFLASWLGKAAPAMALRQALALAARVVERVGAR